MLAGVYAKSEKECRYDIAFNQLVAGENHTRGELIEAARIFQNILAILLRKRAAELEWRQIEKIDIGKAPELIFARR